MRNEKSTDSILYRLSQLGAPLCAMVAAVICWQLTVSVTDVSEVVLPAPGSVLNAVWSMKADLAAAALRTIAAALLGLAASVLVGMCTAFLFSLSSIARRTLYPYAILLQTVPIVAVAPIVIIGCGRGLHSIAVIAAILSLFPVVTSTTTGLLQIERSLLELFHLNSATRWQVFWKLRLPHALPYLITGLRIAGGSAIVGAIVGEFFVGAAQPGLGAMIQKKATGINTDELYATVAASTALGVCLFSTISVVGDIFLQQFSMSLQGASLSTSDQSV